MRSTLLHRRFSTGLKGVTLVEMLVGLAISTIMFLAIAMAIQTQSRSSNREISRVDMLHNLQLAAHWIRKDVRMAGYQSGVMADMNVGAITAANQGDITFAYDTNDDTNRESISYRLDAPGDVGYNAAHPRLLKVDNDTPSIHPVGSDITAVAFKYYDAAGAQLLDANINGAMGTQANRDNIEVIEILISARSDKINQNTNAYITGQLAFRVMPRNF